MPSNPHVNFLDSINEPVYILDQGCVLVYVNPAFEQATGYLGPAVLGRKCDDLLHQPGPCNQHCPLKRILSGQETKTTGFNSKIQTSDGRIKHFSCLALRARSRNQLQAVVLLLPDPAFLRQHQEHNQVIKQQLLQELQHRQQREQSLRLSEAMYRAIFEHTGTAMVIMDNNGTITMANRELGNMIGRPLEQVVGCNAWDQFVHPDDLPMMQHYHRERRKKNNQAPRNYEFRIIHTAGKTVHVFMTIAMIPGSRKSIGSFMDITRLKEAEQALRESEDKYRRLLENIEDVFYEVDLKGNFTFVNAAVGYVFGGYTKDQLIGLNFREIVDEENATKVLEAFNKVYTSGIPERGFSWSILLPDGGKRETEISISPIRDRQGNITGFRGMARDITERKLVEKRLRYLSLHDSLTGLYNRTYLDEELERLHHQSEFPVSIICGDLDDLKKVNDTRGHKKGDELLVVAASVMQNAVRKTDILARVGGDEFVVVLPGADALTATRVIERISAAIAQNNMNNPALPLSISLGWATSTEGEHIMDTYKRADDNMYIVKRQRQVGCR